jgi:hypothetical protein
MGGSDVDCGGRGAVAAALGHVILVGGVQFEGLREGQAVGQGERGAVQKYRDPVGDGGC